MTNKNRLLFLLTAMLTMALLTSCNATVPIFGGTIGYHPDQQEVEENLAPTQIDVSFFASANLNPSPSGNPTPVSVHIYELKSFRNFEDADFFELYDNPEQILGDALLSRDRVQISPQSPPMTYLRELRPETQYIGFLASYRDPDQARWRAITEKLEANKTTNFAAMLGSNEIVLSKMQEDKPRGSESGSQFNIDDAKEQFKNVNDGVKDVVETREQIKSLDKNLKDLRQ